MSFPRTMFRRTGALLSRMAPTARPWMWVALGASAGLNLWFVWETPLVPFKPVCAVTEPDGDIRFRRLSGLPDAESHKLYGMGTAFSFALRRALVTHGLRYDIDDRSRIRIRFIDYHAIARMRHITTHATHLLLRERGIAEPKDLVHRRVALPGFDPYGRPNCDMVSQFAFNGGRWQYDGPNPIPGTPDPAEQRKGD